MRLAAWAVVRAGRDAEARTLRPRRHGVKDHEAYIGDRTYESLSAFADNLAVSAGQPHHYVRCAPTAAALRRAEAGARRRAAWPCGSCRGRADGLGDRQAALRGRRLGRCRHARCLVPPQRVCWTYPAGLA